MDEGRKRASRYVESAHEALTLALESLALGDPIVWHVQQQVDILGMLMEGLEAVAELEATGPTEDTKSPPFRLGPKRPRVAKSAAMQNERLRRL